jgi:NADH-quinone oxidoreductase chain I
MARGEVMRTIWNLIGVLKPLWVSARNLLRRPVTVMYPRDSRHIPERIRGLKIGLMSDESGNPRCTACMACARICPARVIEVEGERVGGRMRPKRFTVNLGSCIFCGLCAQACPADAIAMIRNPGWAAMSREELVLSLEELLEIGSKEGPSWQIGSRIRGDVGG